MSKRVNSSALNQLITGVARLLEGQKVFADEFGLKVARVFPSCQQLVQSDDIAAELEKLVRGNAEAAENLAKLMPILVDHQLALLAGLDGVACQTLTATQVSVPWLYRCEQWIRSKLPLKFKQSKRQAYMDNQQLRYQKIVVPGFLQRYLQTREQLAIREGVNNAA